MFCDSNRRMALGVAAGATIAFCACCGSAETTPADTASAPAPASSSTVGGPPPTVAPVCNTGQAGAPDVAGVFSNQLPHQFLVKEICAGDVGPGLAGADAV